MAETADAVMIDESRKTGKSKFARINSILNIVEPLMGLDPKKGEKGYIRRQPGGRLYISPSPADTIDYPSEDPEERTGARYNWIDHPSDPTIQLGYLKDRPIPETPDAA